MSLLAGCSSEENQAASTAGQSSTPTVSSTTATPTTIASAPASTTTTPSSSVAKTPAAQSLLLTTGQLPDMGWKPQSDNDPEATELQETTQPECSNQSWSLRTANMTDKAGAAWTFDAAAQVETISSQAFIDTDAASATAALASYRNLAARCTSWQSILTEKGYTYAETQEAFDAPAGEESVARQGRTSLICHPDIPTGPVYWVTSRVGQSIVQITYSPGTLLGTNQDGNKPLSSLRLRPPTSKSTQSRGVCIENTDQ